MTRLLNLFVVETTFGTWSYHLSRDGVTGHPALCGRKDVMSTAFHIENWGYVGELKERYCKKCERIASDQTP